MVPEQELPDPDFTTLEYPNPEDPKAYTLALKLAKEKDADIILATDPDADRLGIYAKDTATGEYIPFTGNMSGMLIAEYILREKKKMGTLPANGALIKSIVTTNLADALARDYGLKLIKVLTGFKYIGEQIKQFEETHENEYVFGLEESYGCLVGTHARDKDAVVAVMCLCEVAAYCKKQGITVWDQMQKIYAEHGFYMEGIHTLTLKGIEGAQQIKDIMEKFRNDPPKAFGDLKALCLRDMQKDQVTDFVTGGVSGTGLPTSNVLYFELENDSWCCLRPSGTEPKLKFYMGVRGENMEDTKEKLQTLMDALIGII